LPPKPARSKLEPYAELIEELRKRDRSYREIAGILAERCGVPVAIHTVYNFVRVRAEKPKKAGGGPRRADQSQPSAASSPSGAEATAQTADPEVWQRIQELKQRPTAARATGAEKVFHYDENAPLTRVPETKQKG
jgi:IS30 family transposase